jgi:hypothetical protein
MSGAHKSIVKAHIIPADADREAALDRLCPDLAEWPRSWRAFDSDVVIGQSIVELLKPFLHELLRSQLADKTLRRHRDHLWMLGGEIIRRRHDDPDLCKQSLKTLLFNFIEEEGGPLIWPRISESGQNSFDATCRKLYRFLQQCEIP